jgi:hypothetical protein
VGILLPLIDQDILSATPKGSRTIWQIRKVNERFITINNQTHPIQNNRSNVGEAAAISIKVTELMCKRHKQNWR